MKTTFIVSPGEYYIVFSNGKARDLHAYGSVICLWSNFYFNAGNIRELFAHQKLTRITENEFMSLVFMWAQGMPPAFYECAEIQKHIQTQI